LGSKRIFHDLKLSYPDLINIVEILTKLKSRSELSDEEKTSYDLFKQEFAGEDSQIIEEYINGRSEIPFEIIEQYIKNSVRNIQRETKTYIKFFIENPQYKVLGSFLKDMMDNHSDELSNLISKNAVLKEYILKLKDYILPSIIDCNDFKELIVAIEAAKEAELVAIEVAEEVPMDVSQTPCADGSCAPQYSLDSNMTQPLGLEPPQSEGDI
jgi:hypothetical protein